MNGRRTMTRTRVRRRRSLVAGAAGLLVAAGLAVAAPTAVADTSPIDPTDPQTPVTVSADGLPTAQINGVAWSQTVVGNTVYVGGSFTKARPPGAAAGTSEVARSNLLAYDVTTGQLVPGFAPVVNGQVRTVSASPDGTRVYIGGSFTSVDGQTRNRIAAFDTASGALVSGFAPPVNYDVYSVVATNTTVYAGGDFQGVGTRDRGYLAAFRATTGTLLDWAPQAAGGKVWALAVNPEGTKVTVGGQFTTLNGSANPGYGLGMVDATTGATLPMAANTLVRNGGADAAIVSLSSDAGNVYGSGYTFGSGGTLEGTFAAGWDGGTVRWVNDCHGDTYSVHPRGGALYSAGHTHYCGNMGGFPQTDPDWTFYRGLAFGTQATGVADRDPYGYASFKGQPTSHAAGVVPLHQLRHLHRHEPGPVVRRGQPGLRRHGRRVHQGQQQGAAGPGPLPGRIAVAERPGPDPVQRDVPAQRVLDRGRDGPDQLVDQPGHRQRRADLPRLPRRPAQGRARARAPRPRAVLGAVHDGVHRHGSRARIDPPVPRGRHRRRRQHRQLAVDDGHGRGVRQRQRLPRGGAGQRARRPVAPGRHRHHGPGGRGGLHAPHDGLRGHPGDDRRGRRRRRQGDDVQRHEQRHRLLDQADQPSGRAHARDVVQDRVHLGRQADRLRQPAEHQLLDLRPAPLPRQQRSGGLRGQRRRRADGDQPARPTATTRGTTWSPP